MIIGLTGLPRSGKDTVAAYLVCEHGYTRLAFADPLKEAAAILLDRPVWQMRGDDNFDREAILPEWGFSTRDFLQRFGTEVMRKNFGADFWLRHMRNKLGPQAQDENVVITDCRFPNEVDLIHELGGVVVTVFRPGCKSTGHVSDQPVPYDYGLVNSSTFESLYLGIESMLARVKAIA